MIIFIIIIVVIVVFAIIISNNKKGKNNDITESSNYIPEKSGYSIDFDLTFEKSELEIGEYLVFDIETTGLVFGDRNNLENYPRIVQLCWFLFDEKHKLIDFYDTYIKQNKPIPVESIKIHHITTEIANKQGEPLKDVLERFINVANKARIFVAHNVSFDLPIINAELCRLNMDTNALYKFTFCTMKASIKYCNLYHSKFPSLEELVGKCFFNKSITIKDGHDAQTDARFTAKCFFYLLDNKIVDITTGLSVYNLKKFHGSEKLDKKYLIQNENIKDNSNIFYNKKVVITGIFEKVTRNDIGKYLFDVGADVNTSISSVTDFVITGNNAGPAKMKKISDLIIKGSSIKVLSEEDFIKIKEFK